jgi:nitronate monooxygenase
VVKAAHSYGGIVMHDVISLRHAEKAAEQGSTG